jgi:hypothetical protein
MKYIILIFLPFLLFSCASLKTKGTCNDEIAYPSKIVTKVAIKPFSNKPSFYYVAESWVVFISPEDMGSYLGLFDIKNKELPSYKLINKIKSDLDLTENKDLLQYNFETWDYGILIESLVIALAKKGQVSVIAPGGTSLEFITSVEHNEAYSNYTVVHAGEDGVNSMLFERDCIAD